MSNFRDWLGANDYNAWLAYLVSMGIFVAIVLAAPGIKDRIRARQHARKMAKKRRPRARHRRDPAAAAARDYLRILNQGQKPGKLGGYTTGGAVVPPYDNGGDLAKGLMQVIPPSAYRNPYLGSQDWPTTKGHGYIQGDPPLHRPWHGECPLHEGKVKAHVSAPRFIISYLRDMNPVCAFDPQYGWQHFYVTGELGDAMDAARAVALGELTQKEING